MLINNVCQSAAPYLAYKHVSLDVCAAEADPLLIICKTSKLETAQPNIYIRNTQIKTSLDRVLIWHYIEQSWESHSLRFEQCSEKSQKKSWVSALDLYQNFKSVIIFVENETRLKKLFFSSVILL